jgi:hypothetical protein
MTTRKRQIREPEEPVAATDPIVTPKREPEPDPGALGEYELNGNTFQFTAADAKRLGAKAVAPQNKAVTPRNK